MVSLTNSLIVYKKRALMLSAVSRSLGFHSTSSSSVISEKSTPGNCCLISEIDLLLSHGCICGANSVLCVETVFFLQESVALNKPRRASTARRTAHRFEACACIV